LHYHIILTDHCNLSCSYCRGKLFLPSAPEEKGADIDGDLPVELDYDLENLYRFLEKDPDASLIFYGGEPLLRPDLVCEMVEHAPVKRFLVQTNGLLLDRIPRDVVNRLDTILVSIDGSRETTDGYRGGGDLRQGDGQRKEGRLRRIPRRDHSPYDGNRGDRDRAGGAVPRR
jgi:MoaA/NifB/PqqE/SkfB family radical SAM enzyme